MPHHDLQTFIENHKFVEQEQKIKMKRKKKFKVPHQDLNLGLCETCDTRATQCSPNGAMRHSLPQSVKINIIYITTGPSV